MNFGLFNDDDYCERVDYYNLGHPANLFEKKNFFTDYGPHSIDYGGLGLMFKLW